VHQANDTSIEAAQLRANMPRRHPSHSMAPCSVQVVVLEKLEYGACSRLDEGHEIEACDQVRYPRLPNAQNYLFLYLTLVKLLI
jgi:hypothetical protein